MCQNWKNIGMSKKILKYQIGMVSMGICGEDGEGKISGQKMTMR